MATQSRRPTRSISRRLLTARCLCLLLLWQGPVLWLDYHDNHASQTNGRSAQFDVSLAEHLRRCHADLPNAAPRTCGWHFHLTMPDDETNPDSSGSRRTPRVLDRINGPSSLDELLVWRQGMRDADRCWSTCSTLMESADVRNLQRCRRPGSPTLSQLDLGFLSSAHDRAGGLPTLTGSLRC